MILKVLFKYGGTTNFIIKKVLFEGVKIRITRAIPTFSYTLKKLNSQNSIKNTEF